MDGVLGTADILEDLLLLGALEGKVVIGSMNRGGLAGAAFELDDRFTGYDADAIAAMGFDGGKMLLPHRPGRPGHGVHPGGAAPGRSRELAGTRLMAMVEPFMSRRVDGRVRNDLSAEAVVTLGRRSPPALGATSAYTWLKLPVVRRDGAGDGGDHAARAAARRRPGRRPRRRRTRPGRRRCALPGVRGLVVGRALLYPPDGDVAAAVDGAAAAACTAPGRRA